MYLLVHLVCLRLVTVKPNDRELLEANATVSKRRARQQKFKIKKPYSLNLARVNLNDPNPSRDKLLPQRVRKTPDGRLGSTVNAATGIRLPAGDGADVDDVAGAAVGPLLENRQDGLRDVDQAGDVGREHDVDVFLCDLGCFCDTFDEATIIMSRRE